MPLPAVAIVLQARPRSASRFVERLSGAHRGRLLESYKALLRNVLVEHKCNNVACIKAAAWKYDDPELTLFSFKDIGYSSMHHYYTDSYPETVEGRSLDTWMAGNNHPRFIKIDCEGTEMEVLVGARDILKKGVDCVVLEFNYHILQKTGRQDRDIRQYMANLGYDCFLINIGYYGHYENPIKVPPDKKINIHGINGADDTPYINVMFSTEEKVKQRWT